MWCSLRSVAESCDYEILQRVWDDCARRSLVKRGAAARRWNHINALEDGSLRIKLVMKKGGKGGFSDPYESDGGRSDATEARD